MTRARRLTRISTGFALLTAGVAMLVLPGPGLLAMAGGLALLRRELPWAARVTRPLDDLLARFQPAGLAG